MQSDRLGCHTPAIRSSHVARALERMRTFAGQVVPYQPDPVVLEEMPRALLGLAA